MKKENILISRAANLSVADLFEIQAKNNPKLLAVQDVDGKKYQYRQTLNRVLKISKIFINKGVKPKDRIAIISENRKEYLLALFSSYPNFVETLYIISNLKL